ncbi:hypothetical protein SAMN02745724_03747, partial [Pseudoalteromonas denitrificans DSM 6059]
MKDKNTKAKKDLRQDARRSKSFKPEALSKNVMRPKSPVTEFSQSLFSAPKQMEVTKGQTDHNAKLGSVISQISKLGSKTKSPKLVKAMSGLAKLDLKQLETGDLSSLVSGLPEVLESINLKEAIEPVLSSINAFESLDIKQIANGDLSSLAKVGPELLRKLDFKEAANVLSQGMDLVEQVDIKQIANGDLSSLAKAGPDLL